MRDDAETLDGPRTVRPDGPGDRLAVAVRVGWCAVSGQERDAERFDREWAEAFLREWSRPYFGDDAKDAVALVQRAARATTAPVVAAIRDEGKAEALREAADQWTQGRWSDVMLPKPVPPAVPVIDYSNRVGEWLRECAALLDGGDQR